MWITEAQFLVLLDSLRGSLRVADGRDSIWTYNINTRREFYIHIINQQEGEMEVKEKTGGRND